MTLKEVTAKLEQHHKLEMDEALRNDRTEIENLKLEICDKKNQISTMQEEQALEIEQILCNYINKSLKQFCVYIGCY